MDEGDRCTYVDEPKGVNIGLCDDCDNDDLPAEAEPCESCLTLWEKSGGKEVYAWRQKEIATE